ncbi:hypothetical protein DSC45_19390 [Streptomyces sp. YIM 130001]|uniref:hypothetical protein n=1 Tax=Streptomyces sp. YIM 130001 TaxID=2259644 RepID=UPI000E64C18E|nr:hypothetical protein [Streptomyces sp. YIM 130001]RII15061.1 hypothetical protein DSC45_19390 [Streptomyces sp. YIM 130001]
MQQIGPRVGMRLIHVTHTERRGSTTYRYYRIQTAWVDRPPERARLGYLRCATCGDMVGFRLHSEAGARARRRWWLAAVLIAATVPAVLSVLTATAVHGDEWISTTALPIGLALAALIVFVAVLHQEDGVTPVRRKSGPHHFKPLNPRGARSKPHATDWPVRAEIVFHDSDPLDYGGSARDPLDP